MENNDRGLRDVLQYVHLLLKEVVKYVMSEFCLQFQLPPCFDPHSSPIGFSVNFKSNEVDH